MAYLGLDWSELQEAWDRVKASGYLTEGYYVRKFEEAVQGWTGLHAVAVSSAGTGLFSVLRNSNLKWGPIFVPNNTFYATGAMARETGRPVWLVDCHREDFSMDYSSMRGTNLNPSAVIVTHVGGSLAVDTFRLAEWCRHRCVPFFEDAAHAMGVGDGGKTAGVHSDAAIFSLYPTKAIPAGEGGMIVTKHHDLAERLREFRNYGKHKVDGVIRYNRSGFNFRMDEWTAAVCYLQMKRRQEIIELRTKVAKKLMEVIPPIPHWPRTVTNWYKYPVLKADADKIGVTRFSGKIYQSSDQLVAALGIPDQGPFPNSDWVAENHVCLPLDENLYQDMSQSEIRRWLQGG